MKILVVGIGALGTVYAGLLSQGDHEVYGLDLDSIVREINQNGIKVSGIWGDHQSAKVRAVSDTGKLTDIKWDLIIITVKSFQTEKAVASIKNLLSANTLVCLLQNGYGNYEKAAAIIPKEQLVAGRVIFGAETLAPGVSKVTVMADDVRIGSPERLITLNRLNDLAQMFSVSGIPTKETENIMEYIWGKIIYNSALNPLGAIFEVNYGKLVKNDFTIGIMNRIIREIFELLAAMGQKTLWSDAESYLKVFYDQLVPSTAAHHPSMLQDINNGRKTEIDALNGAIAELADKYGLETLTNRLIADMIKSKEMLTNMTNCKEKKWPLETDFNNR